MGLDDQASDALGRGAGRQWRQGRRSRGHGVGSPDHRHDQRARDPARPEPPDTGEPPRQGVDQRDGHRRGEDLQHGVTCGIGGASEQRADRQAGSRQDRGEHAGDSGAGEPGPWPLALEPLLHAHQGAASRDQDAHRQGDQEPGRPGDQGLARGGLGGETGRRRDAV